jgi:hypothetical protein
MGKSLQVLLLASLWQASAQTIDLRGRVLAASTGRVLDSVIVRLLVSDTSVYSTAGGVYRFGSATASLSEAGSGGSPSLRLEGGRLWAVGGFSADAKLTVRDLTGRAIRSAGLANPSGGDLDISSAVATESVFGTYFLSIYRGRNLPVETRRITVHDGKIASISPLADGDRLQAARTIAASSDTLHLWKPGFKAKKVAIANLADSLADISLDTLTAMQTAPAPLFRDPIWNGAADPTISWNTREKAFWIFYTNRRATCTNCTGVSWVFGTDIGIASSFDGGASWQYRGIAKQKGKKDLNWNTATNTFWAPDIVYSNGVYHMYVSITPGILTGWNESIAGIVHLTATDPLNGWSYDAVPYTAIHSGIDAAVRKLGDGIWHMWGKFSDVLQSTDLVKWTVKGTEPTGGEGPFVFFFQGYYWMLRDPDTDGLRVYRSTDGTTWTEQSAFILVGAGTRSGDVKGGSHPSILLQGNKAYIFYFAQEAQISSLQVAQLSVSNGILSAIRNTPFEFILRHYDDSMR